MAFFVPNDAGQGARFFPTQEEERRDPIFIPNEDIRKDPSLFRQGLAMAARIVPPVAGAGAGFVLGGPAGMVGGGALGGAVGETIAQQIERPGERPQPLPILGEAALGAVPFGRAAAPFTKAASRFIPGRLASSIGTGIEAAGFGAGATTVQTGTREGRLPTGEELALGAGVGGALGIGLGAARFRPETPGVDRPMTVTEEAAKRAQERDIRIRQEARGLETTERLLPQKAIRAFTEAVSELPKDALENTDALRAGLRVNRGVAELIEKGELPDFQTPEGLLDLAERFALTSSSSGMTLEALSKISNPLNKLVGREARNQGPGWFMQGVNLMRVAMTSMLGTAMRNIGVSYVRGGLTGAARTISGLADPQAGITGLKLLGNLARPVKAFKATKTALENAPEVKQGLLSLGISETDADNAIIKFMRVFNAGLNKFQENTVRQVPFMTFLDDEFTRIGLSIDDWARNPKAFFRALDPVKNSEATQALGRAISLSRSIAFSEDPSGPVGQAVAGLVNKVPLLALEVPFPRFMVSAANFMVNYSPLGMVRLFAPEITKEGITRVGGQAVFRASDPRFVAERLGEVAVGTGLLGVALALRGAPETRGDRNFELKVPGISEPLDMRPLFPLLTPHLFMAEALLKMDEKGSLADMESAEILDGMLGLSRIRGVSTLLGQLTRRDVTTEGMREIAETFFGDILGRFSIPFRTLRDIFGDDRSVDQRQDSMMRMFGPSLGNIPFAGEVLDLPRVIKPTTGKDIAERRPVNVFGVNIPAGILKQLGVSTREKDEVEAVLDQLGIRVFGISPRTTVSRTSELRPFAKPLASNIDRRISTIMGPTVLAAGSALINSEGFKDLIKTDPKLAEIQLRGLIERIRETARIQAQAELSVRQSLLLKATRPAVTAGQLGRQRGFEEAFRRL